VSRSFLPILLLLPLAVHGWGATGHRVVADIAQRHLSPKAQAAVSELLDGRSMADVSTWMDEVRRDPKYRHTSTWHWVTIPDGQTYASSAKNPKGDVVEATGRTATTLGDKSATREERKLALMFLIHLVGDLHQPLHVGNGLDKGGNEFQVRWGNRGSNLHRVWDSGIIDLMSESREDLLAQIPTAHRRTLRAWQSGSAVDWAQECVEVRPGIYSVSRGDRLGEPYAKAHWDLVKTQLHKAGVRLAWLIERALG
jgi:hypothetical protein